LQAVTEDCLKGAVKAGDLPRDSNCTEIASFVISSMQGAILLAKTHHSSRPIDHFEKTLFSTVLGKEA
jgi:TetR/AcrR family transcriptional repressor of nem operon